MAVVALHQVEGDAVALDENVVELETDKVTLEVPAPAAGVIGEICAAEGVGLTLVPTTGAASDVQHVAEAVVVLAAPLVDDGVDLGHFAAEALVGLVRLPSGEIRMFHINCRAVVGQVGVTRRS